MNLDINQGSVVIESARVVRKSKSIVLIEIDCATKNPTWVSYGFNETPGVCLGVDEYSLHAHPTLTTDTFITFPEYDSFDVFAVSGGRYTIRVCLLKENSDG